MNIVNAILLSEKEQYTMSEATEKELTYDELKAKANAGEKLTEDEIKRLKFHDQAKDKADLEVIIRGVNNVWRRHYSFKEMGIDFTIAIHAPSILEQGKINALREQYLQGSGSFAPSSLFVAFQTLATIRVCGEEVPDFLKSDEDIYAVHILQKIGYDFSEWLDSFRY